MRARSTCKILIGFFNEYSSGEEHVSFFIGRVVEKAFQSCDLIVHIMYNIGAMYFYSIWLYRCFSMIM